MSLLPIIPMLSGSGIFCFGLDFPASSDLFPAPLDFFFELQVLDISPSAIVGWNSWSITLVDYPGLLSCFGEEFGQTN
jgi:hypothetical protein